jgi:tetratricopeptide (TPR) repeat protein
MKKKLFALLFAVVMLFAVCGYAFADVQMYTDLQETYGVGVPDFLSAVKGIPTNSDNCSITTERPGYLTYTYLGDLTDDLDTYHKILEENGFKFTESEDADEMSGFVKIDSSRGEIWVFDWINPDEKLNTIGVTISVTIPLHDNENGVKEYNIGEGYLQGYSSDGKFVGSDNIKAMQWFKKSAEKGNTAAMNRIGNLYNGYGNPEIQKDSNLAFKWYKQAADLGNTDAMSNVAYMYEHGEGIQQDFIEAREWYQKAVDAGDESAKEQLARLDKAEKGPWLDTCGDLIALDYPEYLESLKDESGFLFGRSTYHLGITEKNSRIIAETGLGYFEDGYGPVIKGLQLGKFVTREELKTLMEGMYGARQITDEYNRAGKQISYELSLGNSSRGRLVVLLAVGDDEVGFRISLIRIPPAIFGGQNLGIRDFAKEIVNHYPVGTLNLVNLGNGETRYFSEVSDSYNNGWYASIEKYGVVLANSIFSKAVERVQQNREAAIQYQKDQMTFD